MKTINEAPCSESMTNIIYENIDDNYGKGRYLDTEVIIMKSNGYINITKLCTNNTKQFSDWTRMTNSKELLKAFSGYEDGGNLLIQMKFGGTDTTNIIRGTYVHQDLVPIICVWVSPTLALKVSKIVNNYINEQYKIQVVIAQNEAKRIKEEMGGIIVQKEDKFDKLQKMMNEMKLENQKMAAETSKILQRSDAILGKLDDAETQNENLQEQLEESNEKQEVIIEQLETVQTHLKIATKTRVIMHKDKVDNGAFVLMLDTNSTSDGKRKLYMMRRLMNKSLEKAITNRNIEEDGSEVILRIEFNANPISFAKHFREKFKNNMEFIGNSIILDTTIMTIDELITDTRRLHDNRKIVTIVRGEIIPDTPIVSDNEE